MFPAILVGEAIWTPICLEGAYEMIIRNAGKDTSEVYVNLGTEGTLEGVYEVTRWIYQDGINYTNTRVLEWPPPISQTVVAVFVVT